MQRQVYTNCKGRLRGWKRGRTWLDEVCMSVCLFVCLVVTSFVFFGLFCIPFFPPLFSFNYLYFCFKKYPLLPHCLHCTEVMYSRRVLYRARPDMRATDKCITGSLVTGILWATEPSYSIVSVLVLHKSDICQTPQYSQYLCSFLAFYCHTCLSVTLMFLSSRGWTLRCRVTDTYNKYKYATAQYYYRKYCETHTYRPIGVYSVLLSVLGFQHGILLSTNRLLWLDTIHRRLWLCTTMLLAWISHASQTWLNQALDAKLGREKKADPGACRGLSGKQIGCNTTNW